MFMEKIPSSSQCIQTMGNVILPPLKSEDERGGIRFITYFKSNDSRGMSIFPYFVLYFSKNYFEKIKPNFEV